MQRREPIVARVLERVQGVLTRMQENSLIQPSPTVMPELPSTPRLRRRQAKARQPVLSRRPILPVLLHKGDRPSRTRPGERKQGS